MVNLKIRFDLLKIKRYFRDNWGTLFIILFQAFILSSGRFLIQNNSALADKIAVYAFYSLAIGVILQLISFTLGERRKQEEND